MIENHMVLPDFSCSDGGDYYGECFECGIELTEDASHGEICNHCYDLEGEIAEDSDDDE